MDTYVRVMLRKHHDKFIIAGGDLFICMPNGFWRQLTKSRKDKDKSHSILQHYLTDAANAESDESRDSFATREVVEAISVLQKETEMGQDTILRRIQTREFNRHLLVPVNDEGAYDIAQSRVLYGKELADCLHIASDGDTAHYDENWDSTQVPDLLAQFMGQMGSVGKDFLDFIARNLASGTNKSIDFWINQTENAGKSTLCNLVKNSLGAAVVVMQATGAFATTSSKQFAFLEKELCKTLVVIIEECQNAGGEKGLQAKHFNPLTDDELSVELKGENTVILKRTGNTILVGNGLPKIEPGSGLAARFNMGMETDLPSFPDDLAWVARDVKTDRASLEYLSNVILRQASEHYNGNGFDEQKIAAYKQTAKDALQAIYPEEITCLMRYLEPSNKKEETDEPQAYPYQARAIWIKNDLLAPGASPQKAKFLPQIKKFSPKTRNEQRRNKNTGKHEQFFSYLKVKKEMMAELTEIMLSMPEEEQAIWNK